MADRFRTQRLERSDREDGLATWFVDELPDPLVDELRREIRHRRVLVIAAVIGIIAGAASGLGAVLGAFGEVTRGMGGPRNPAALIFFIGPPIVSMALGYAVFGLRRLWSPRVQDPETASDAGTSELPGWPRGGGAAIVVGMKLKGTIRRSDLEGGHWVLETDGGERYQLTGSLGSCKDGLVAEVEGKLDKNAIGFGMTGPQLAVQKITAHS